MKARKKRTRAHGKLTDAGLRGRITSALRRLSKYWEPKNAAKKAARCGRVTNPETGRLVMATMCKICNGIIAEKDSEVDHIKTVVPLEGFGAGGFLGYDWSVYIENLLCEEDGFQVLCGPCHKIRTNNQNEERRKHKSGGEK